MVIEEPSRTRVLRTAGAAVAAAASIAAGAALWAYGRQTDATVPDAGGIFFLGSTAHLVGGWWLRRLTRRGDFRWRESLALPGGVRSGLVAARDGRAVAINTVSSTAFVGGGLLMAGGGHGWYGGFITVIAAAAAVVAACSLFGVLRRSGYLAITSLGVTVRGEFVRWEQIASVQQRENAIDLELAQPGEPRSLHFGGPDCAVSDERVIEVLRFYLDNPGHRPGLDSGLAVDALKLHR